MDEKFRVLKKGHFSRGVLPEENGDNYEYLYQVKAMAKESGFFLLCKGGMEKGNFVANTGRKAKNTEDIFFFQQSGVQRYEARCKKDKAEPEPAIMSGVKGSAHGDIQPPPKGSVYQAEKPVKLLKQIIEFVTKRKKS